MNGSANGSCSNRMGQRDVHVSSLDASCGAQEEQQLIHWFSALDHDDQVSNYLQGTDEYKQVMDSLRNLYSVHCCNVSRLENSSSTPSFSLFPTKVASEDLLGRILDFCDAQSLVAVSRTSKRLHHLVNRAAKDRMVRHHDFPALPNYFQLVRAREQIVGIGTELGDSHVPIPTLLLPRRIIISDCGDPEYNGVYFCTSTNANGFLFTKPRGANLRVGGAGSGIWNTNTATNDPISNEDYTNTELKSYSLPSGQLLRCIIGKRFSNETLLWYLSKEVVQVDETTGSNRVSQVFQFWSKLMTVGVASPDVCRYPSQTSVLRRNDDSWQTLEVTGTQAPTVELLDG